jgi:hypothetical protein
MSDEPEANQARRPTIQIAVIKCDIFVSIEDGFGGKFAFRLLIDDCAGLEKKLREARHMAIQDQFLMNAVKRHAEEQAAAGEQTETLN